MSKKYYLLPERHTKPRKREEPYFDEFTEILGMKGVYSVFPKGDRKCVFPVGKGKTGVIIYFNEDGEFNSFWGKGVDNILGNKLKNFLGKKYTELQELVL